MQESLFFIKFALVRETLFVKLLEKPKSEGSALGYADELEAIADAFIHSERRVGLAHFSISHTAARVSVEIGAGVGAHVHQADHASDQRIALLIVAHVFCGKKIII